MVSYTAEARAPRAGRTFRSNGSRYFHVMNAGWYVNTRDGIVGPFMEKAEANRYLDELKTQSGELERASAQLLSLR